MDTSSHYTVDLADVGTNLQEHLISLKQNFDSRFMGCSLVRHREVSLDVLNLA